MERIRQQMRQQNGNVAILVAVFMVALLGFSALVMDVGLVFVEKSRLDQALDAAALAGAQDLPLGTAVATQTAQTYLTLNNVALEDVTIDVLDAGKTIRLTGKKNVKHFFAPAIGIKESLINSSSKAIIGPAKSVFQGIRPVAITDYPLNYGEMVVLKEGAGDGNSGNYGAVSFGPTGASIFQQYLIYGYDSSLTVGDIIQTEPGNMAGAIMALSSYLAADTSTFEDYQLGSKRLWTIPVINTLDVVGRKDVEIVGFAQFFVEYAAKIGGDAEIHGRFIKFVTSGEIDNTIEDRGVYVSKLSR